MGRLCQTDGLTDDQTEILKAVRSFVEREILPVATELEHADEYPTKIVEGLKELGIFGLMIPEEYDGLGESLLTYALAVEEIARGWMSVSGIINTHFIVAYLLLQHGTEEQKRTYLPRMATGEVRGAFSMSEPGCGSDVARSPPRRPGTRTATRSTGQKMWLTNGGSANLVAVLVKTDEGADSVYRNMTTFLVEKEAGFGETAQGVTIPGKIEKMGYKGVDTTEMVFEGHRISRRPDPRRRARPGLLPDDGRRRGRPRQRRGPRLRGRQPRLRARGGLRPAARDLRQEDRRAPGRPVPAGRDGDQDRGRPPDDGQGRPDQGQGRAQRPRGGHGQVPRQRSTARRSSRTPSASTAATASPRSTRSSASTARRRCCSSARAPPTSSG